MPGSEAAGLVIELGEGVEGLSVCAECGDAIEIDCCIGSGCDVDSLSGSEVAEALAGIEPGPFRDLYRTFDDLDGIDPDRSVDGVSGQDFMDATDVSALTVVSDPADDATTISISFGGAAQEAVTEETGTLMSRAIGADVLISPPEGRVLNVLFDSDGKTKISDIPSGMSITSEWLTPDELLIVIAGLLLAPGTQIEAFVLIEAYGGFMSDVVSLVLSSS